MSKEKNGKRSRGLPGVHCSSSAGDVPCCGSSLTRPLPVAWRLSSPNLHTQAVAEWDEIDGALERTFELASFPAAIGFVGRVADLAEAENHHPDITINYRKVTLRWATHEAGGITDRDRELAARSDALAD
jgi:4a-hydroxytetrahydrobiopterin dehydratase